MMAMFPISVEGAIDIPADGANAALDRLKDAVAAKGATYIKLQPDKLAFTARVFFGFSSNPLLIFDQCVVLARPQKLEYSCSTRSLFILFTAGTMFVGFEML